MPSARIRWEKIIGTANCKKNIYKVHGYACGIKEWLFWTLERLVDKQGIQILQKEFVIILKTISAFIFQWIT